MSRTLSFAPEARDDLQRLFEYIAAQSGARRALGYIERIEAFCGGLVDFPERGLKRDDLSEGLRTVGFERRVLIAFLITPDAVIIDRVLYGGRSLGEAFNDNG